MRVLILIFCSLSILQAQTQPSPSDPQATEEVKILLKRLHDQAGKGIMIGHQDATAYGVGWRSETGRSDIKEVCGDYPAVYGWDLGDIHLDHNLDGVSFTEMKRLIREADARGGINTISMHLDHPVSGRNAWDNTKVVGQVLPGGTASKKFLATLDLIAAFLGDLKREDGSCIPVILRPFHEHSERWPWWGRSHCEDGEFIALWRMTVNHLRLTRHLHHILYAISPQDIVDEEDYMEGYPGDDYVDIFGLDYYKIWKQRDVWQMGNVLSMVAKLAESHGKISALTETGIDKVPIANWWTERLLPALNHDEWSRKTAWALLWRNKSRGHHFGPHSGHPSAPDFTRFYDSELTIFEAQTAMQEVKAAQEILIKDQHCLSNVAKVVQRGKVLYHRAVNSNFPGDRPITDETLFPIWSMTKPITSVAAMILHERGSFRLDDPVSKVIPQLSQLKVQDKKGLTKPIKREVTFRDLLRHTSGIYGYDGSFHEEGTWKEIIELKDLAEMIDLLVKQPLKHHPGERYTYGMSTAILGRAIEIISGQDFASFLEKEIFQPLDMGDTSFHLNDEDREERFQPLFVKEKSNFRRGTKREDELYYQPGSALALGGEGLISNLRDYGRFCQMLVDRGRTRDGKTIISEETLSLMLSDQMGEIPGYGGERSANHLGLGFYVLENPELGGDGAPKGIYGWSGYHTTHFWIDPVNELYAIFMTRLYPTPAESLQIFRKAVYQGFGQ
ncbi:serine hydrolase [bacterium]|nr:serine hydrolase [bacterium]